MTDKVCPITNRLAAAAGFVRRGARLCDVGTDHAYLPIFLCRAGTVSAALATDINEGPCERARSNIALHALADRITVRCADGLGGAEDFAPTDIVIAGMGGELIRNIILSAPLTRSRGVRLILQPMTKAPALRRALGEHGFAITGEALARDDRIYQIICAEYTGTQRRYTDTELLLGPCNISEQKPLFSDFLEKNIEEQEKILREKRLHHIEHTREDALLCGLYACRTRESEKQ